MPLRDKWREMSRLRRGLLLWMAALILFFAAATAVVRPVEGVEYSGAFLRRTAEGELVRYEGRVDGRSAVFTVSPDSTVEYRWGDHVYGPYRVTEVPDAAPPDDWGELVGIEIRRGDELLFRGGFRPGSMISLYGESGEPLIELGVHFTVSGGTVVDENGREIPQEELHEPGMTILAQLALAPELIHRGSVALYLLVTLLALLNAAQILFPMAFFRLSLLFHVRNIEAAEPSEWYIFGARCGWVLLSVIIPVVYWWALTAVPG